LAKIGFIPVRQKGSHVFLRHSDGRRTVVPLHDEVNKSTIMDIIEQTRLTKEEFLKLLR
jgi:predicted RNA binding protein YcfA (HicA-like mRNA interferase family)